MLGLFFESIIGNLYFFNTLRGSLAGVEAITEHAAAVHMNTVYIFTLAVWIFKGSVTKRAALPLMLPFITITYLATQRRAAFVALAIALLLLAVILYRENRTVFWLTIPAAAVAGALYLGAFWNSTGALGQPAQAVKSVLFENQASVADQSSNIYRTLENVNISYTIHRKPLTGVGFGQKFLIVVPMPDISFFEWWEYLPHNSIMWIWLKSGVGGFLAILYLVGLAVMVGVRALQRMPKNDLSAAALTAVLYIVMHFVYAYVDISWDIQSMLYVGAIMGVINSLERIVARPIQTPRQRWPWQPDPEPAPGLLPLPAEHAP